jgi:hypothetical protein
VSVPGGKFTLREQLAQLTEDVLKTIPTKLPQADQPDAETVLYRAPSRQ